MKSSVKLKRLKLGSLSRRERAIVYALLILLVFYGGDRLLSTFYLEPRQDLQDAVSQAEDQVRHHQKLLSREEFIHVEYKKLKDPVTAARDTALTETEVLRELADLAGKRIHVKSVVPRLGVHEGDQVVFVALDFQGPFQSVVTYLETILREMPSEVARLDLSPRSDKPGSVVCSLSLRVEHDEI